MIAAHGSPCRDRLDAWFATDSAGVAAAIAGCRSCPVLDACKRYAAGGRPEYGVWAGRLYHPAAYVTDRGKRGESAA